MKGPTTLARREELSGLLVVLSRGAPPARYDQPGVSLLGAPAISIPPACSIPLKTSNVFINEPVSTNGGPCSR